MPVCSIFYELLALLKPEDVNPRTTFDWTRVPDQYDPVILQVSAPRVTRQPCSPRSLGQPPPQQIKAMVALDPAARPTFAAVLHALRASPSCPPSYSGKFSSVLAVQPQAGASSALQQAPGVSAVAAQSAAAVGGGVSPRALPPQAGVGLELQPNHEGGLVVTGIVQGSPSAAAAPSITVGDVLHAIDGQVLLLWWRARACCHAPAGGCTGWFFVSHHDDRRPSPHARHANVRVSVVGRKVSCSAASACARVLSSSRYVVPLVRQHMAVSQDASPVTQQQQQQQQQQPTLAEQIAILQQQLAPSQGGSPQQQKHAVLSQPMGALQQQQVSPSQGGSPPQQQQQQQHAGFGEQQQQQQQQLSLAEQIALLQQQLGVAAAAGGAVSAGSFAPVPSSPAVGVPVLAQPFLPPAHLAVQPFLTPVKATPGLQTIVMPSQFQQQQVDPRSTLPIPSLAAGVPTVLQQQFELQQQLIYVRENSFEFIIPALTAPSAAAATSAAASASAAAAAASAAAAAACALPRPCPPQLPHGHALPLLRQPLPQQPLQPRRAPVAR
jgi:hypothetical protein